VRTVAFDACSSARFIEANSEKLGQLGVDALTFLKAKEFSADELFDRFDFVFAGALSTHNAKRLTFVLSGECGDCSVTLTSRIHSML
jgi:hypothetical protein